MPTENEWDVRNAFTADFLSSLDEIGEPDGAHEADVAGPWVVVPVPPRSGAGFAVLREWESLEAGDVPYAVFRRREIALLAAAVLPATGREPLFHLATDPGPAGFPLRAGAAAPPSATVDPTEKTERTERIEEDEGGEGDEGVERTERAAMAARAPMAPMAPMAAMAPKAAEDEAEAAGHLRDFDEGLAAAINLAAAVVRSPACLAMLLEGAGAVALEQAGKILHRRSRQPAALGRP